MLTAFFFLVGGRLQGRRDSERSRRTHPIAVEDTRAPNGPQARANPHKAEHEAVGGATSDGASIEKGA